MSLLPVCAPSTPAVHDEFSHLFVAKTLLTGHLANPTPLHFQHFETFHILMFPAYASIYPVGQGLVLAISHLLFGEFYAGVYLSVGIMCGTLTWMLYGWLPPRWAVLGGALAGGQFGGVHYWIDSYWGGAVAAIGGCLFLGALPRLRATKSLRSSVVLGVGVGIMAISRPFEGFILVLAVAVVGVSYFRASAAGVGINVISRLWPAALSLVPFIILITAQNVSIVGSPVSFPFEYYRKLYAVVPTFVFTPPNHPSTFNNKQMASFFTEWEPEYEKAMELKPLSRLVHGIRARFRRCSGTYIPHRAYLPIAIASLATAFGRRIRLLSFGAIAVLAGSALVNWIMPHYLAVILGPLLAIQLQFLRRVRVFQWKGYRLGVPVVQGIIAFAFIMILTRQITDVKERGYSSGSGRDRVTVSESLLSVPGKHLVFVHYADTHDVNFEWVFNEPQLNQSRVIWARELSQDQDQDLIRSFPGRKVWVLQADANPPTLAALSVNPEGRPVTDR